MSANMKIKRKRLRTVLIVVFTVIALVLIAIGAYAIHLWQSGDKVTGAMFKAQETAPVEFSRETPSVSQTPAPIIDGKPTIEHKGKYYTYNDNIFSILFMGIDSTNDKQYENIGVNSNQADSLILAVIDPVKESLEMINIPRNSITDVKELDTSFKLATIVKAPICIQHAFGDGKEMSCDLTREAASNLLFNIPISRYISLNFDGLIMANDSVGGVTLTLLDDMTAFNPKMEKGKEYKLTQKDAEIYVSRRIGEGLDGTNMSRVKRQVQYYKAFFAVVKERIKENPMFALDLYNSMNESVVTDLSPEEIAYLSKKVINMDMSDERVHTLEGTVDNEDFFVDDEALKDLLVRVFYVEVDH